MMTSESKFNVPNRMQFEAEVDLSAAGAVTALRPQYGSAVTTGFGFTCVKSSTATYTFVFKGNNHGQKMQAIIQRDARINGTPATITTAIVTSVTQATDGSDDITVVVKTTNAAFTETVTTGACNLGLMLVVQSSKVTNPFD